MKNTHKPFGEGSPAIASLPIFQLNELDEAAVYMAGSIGIADTFRLIAHCISNAMTAEYVSLYLLDPTRARLELSQRYGPREPVDEGTPPRFVIECLEGCIVTFSEITTRDAAMPLTRDGRALGVLRITFGDDSSVRHVSAGLWDQIGDSISSLVVSALAFERNRWCALTDALTALPSHRAAMDMLEEHIGRLGTGSLSVLAVDIKDFHRINSTFGRMTADRILESVAHTIKARLRGMDVLARLRADEFLIIMPSASDEICGDVVDRLRNGLAEDPAGAGVDGSVELNFGYATFGPDGQTAGDLLSTALIRKKQHKIGTTETVLRFPTPVHRSA